MADALHRRGFLARSGALAATLFLAGCGRIAQSPTVIGLLGEVENLTRRAQRLFAGGHSLAPEYGKADIAPSFRANGTSPTPTTTTSTSRPASGLDHRSAASGKPLALHGRHPRRAVAARSPATVRRGLGCIGGEGTPLRWCWHSLRNQALCRILLRRPDGRGRC